MNDKRNPRVMIGADNLTKFYGAHPAVKEISFTCQQGEIVGFLGPNGAGKTTTMRILTGYLPPTSGNATIAGYDTLSQSLEARRHLGYLPETVPLYPEMTVEGYLAFVGRVRRVDNLWERVDDVLEDVDLLDRAESYIGALSKGMRQRVGLAQAMLHDPDVLILDEPTIGLDPAQVVELRALIKELGQRHTILLSTHILSEVEQVCDRVIMIIEGEIRADMPLAQIVGTGGEQLLTLHLARPTRDTVDVLQTLVGVRDVASAEDGLFHVHYDGLDETRTAVASTCVNASWGLLEMSLARPTLEAVFLSKMREAERARVAPEEPLHDEEDENTPRLSEAAAPPAAVEEE